MEDTSMDIVGLFVAAILMFLVPLFIIAGKSDDVSQLIAQTATAEFVNEVTRNGTIISKIYFNIIFFW